MNVAGASGDAGALLHDGIVAEPGHTATGIPESFPVEKFDREQDSKALAGAGVDPDPVPARPLSDGLASLAGDFQEQLPSIKHRWKTQLGRRRSLPAQSQHHPGSTT